jgi:hypothetical protein
MWSGVPRSGHRNTPSFQSVSSVITDASTESNVDEFNLGPKYTSNVEGQKSVLRDQTFFNFRVSNFLLSFLDVYCYSSFAVVVVPLCSYPLFCFSC